MRRVPLRHGDNVPQIRGGDSKPPFGGPEAVLAYLSRYTHRVAISNHRLVSADADMVAFRWKDYRAKDGDRQKVMGLATSEFIRRFLMHVLPDGFHRIRHYGLLASGVRKSNLCQMPCVALRPAPGTGECTGSGASGKVTPLTLRAMPLLTKTTANAMQRTLHGNIRT